MKVFVLSCEWGDQFLTLGVFRSIVSAMDTLSSKYLEDEEHIEDFTALDEQHLVVYTNMATYTIDEHILEGVNEE